MPTQYIYQDTSEWALRNASSWCFRHLTLEFAILKNSEGTILKLTKPISEELKANLDRYVNDFKLRELIEERTGRLREEIVKESLSLVYRAKDGSAAD